MQSKTNTIFVTGSSGFIGKPLLNSIIKINPLADWNFKKITNYIKKYKLPEHPLVEKGYKSIGCVPCTSKIAEDDSHRSGRWKNLKKNECGIHSYNPSI